jgi:hypothetical protein
VNHMSQYEHVLFRFKKDGELDNTTVSKVTEMSRAEEHRACSNNHSYGKAYDQILGIIPFYPGAVGNSSLTGNAHSRSPQEVKTLWLKTVVCSLAQYMGSIVIGVCTNEHKAIADSAVGSMLPFANVSVVVINFHCEKQPLFLPYILLRDMQEHLKQSNQKQHHKHVDRSRFNDGIDSIQWDDINYGYFTEMDNALHVDNEDTFDSLIEFISPEKGYVSPNRMNKKVGSPPSSIEGEISYKVSGQNRCNRD